MGKVLFFRGAFAERYATMAMTLADAAQLQTADLSSHYQYPVAAMDYQDFAAYCLGRLLPGPPTAWAAYCLGRPEEARSIADQALAITGPHHSSCAV